MIKRVVDIENPSFLRMEMEQLIIEQNRKVVARIPAEDIGILILQHPAISLTQAVAVSCQENNIVLVFCDRRRIPSSILFPLVHGHTLHSMILKKQISIAPVRKKQLWKQVVQNKIRQQSATLRYFGKDHEMVGKLAEFVKSGDKENHESQASRKYWRLLFGDDFRRNAQEEGINTLLNYGYAVIRAMVARAIVGAGLHPALGICHHNQYNGLNLADDLMEPFRPWVDRSVHRLSEDNRLKIDKETKSILLGIPAKQVSYNGKVMPFMVSCHYLIADFKRAMLDNSLKLNYPEIEKHLPC